MSAEFSIDLCTDGSVAAGVCPDVDSFGSEVILPVQTHSCRVAVVDAPCELPDTDAIITRTPGLTIGVRTADCVPLLLYAPDIRAVAAIHAGWKGTLGGIVSNAVERLTEMGADPALMQAAFGPSICGGCYEVSPELAEDFRRAGYADCILGRRNVDLEAVNTRRLLALGLLLQNIRPKSCCTLETPAFPSWRRTATDKRLLTWIQLTSVIY